MSSSKTVLKAIADAVKQQKYEAALRQAQEFTQREPKNYQALVLLAFSLEKTNRLDEAETTYQAATKLKPNDAQAWQGLTKLYERQGQEKLSSLRNATVGLAEIYRDSEQTYKYQKIVDDFVDFARAQGTTQQYVDALSLTLPGSPVYSAFEGRTRPAETYETIAKILEADEKKQINSLIGERRTRLGAKVSEVTIQVKREVLGHSNLGYIYREIINWSNDDEIRRHYEEKLLQHCHGRLLAFPHGPEKAQELQVVLKLANDMVIIKHPYRLAWEISIDWRDLKETKSWDATVLRDYCTFFPDTDLCRVITGYFSSDISPFPKPEPPSGTPDNGGHVGEESEDDDDGGAPTTVLPLTDEDRLVMMSEGIQTCKSLFAHRLVAEYFEFLHEHESNVESMRKALRLLKDEQWKTGMSFENTGDVFNLHLATALVYYQSPRHHGEAKAIFDDVLSRDPFSTPALIGIGLILEEEENYGEAVDFLDRAQQRDPDNLRVRSEAAWVKALKGDISTSAVELEKCIPLIAAKGDADHDLLAQAEYRLGSCIWSLDSSKVARKNRGPGSAYSCFLRSLKSNLDFAPAYTSLGIYYADYAKDEKRARKCFQKAVELSPSEILSAERLARSFADEADWDRVELVARRIVDSGKVKPPPGSKRKGTSWPFAALGVAELHKQDFQKAIISFQAALRITPDDYHSWVGLGESYYSSGRYISATKAIQIAQRVEETSSVISSDETWFTKFMLANIKRQLSDFDDAIELYQDVMRYRPSEEGVAIALMQTLAENAADCLEKGLFGKAAATAKAALEFANNAPMGIKDTFNFWKTVADSCSIFTSIQGRVTDLPIESIRNLLGGDDDCPEFQALRDVDAVGTNVIFSRGVFSDDEQVSADLTRALHAAILAHKRAIYASAHDAHAQSVAYYNLGWAEQRAHVNLPDEFKKRSSRYSKAAVKCFKRAIELEAGNSEFWNALGVVTSQNNAVVSQHSFVRSLYLNERNVQAWTNLGTLGLFQNDLGLANEAFTRAQSTDPDYAHAWLGQGLVALAFGNVNEARSLFTHAMEISEASSAVSRQQFSTSLFDSTLITTADTSFKSLIQAIFALGQLRVLRPQNLAVDHIRALLQERTHEHRFSVKALEEMCYTLEANYEVTESTQSLERFALAKTDLARAYLAVGSDDQAVNCGETALQLSSDESENGISVEERKKARLSAHLTVGLAHYHQNNITEAVRCFESALQESDGNPDAACLLAQVLWATGSGSARDKARNLLFNVINEKPEHVRSIVLLGVVGILDHDEESLEAVRIELEKLRTSDETTAAEQFDMGEVLQAAAIALVEDGVGMGTGQGLLSQAQTDVLLYPYLPHGWSSLGAMIGRIEEFPREMAVYVASQAIQPKGDLGAEDLAKTYGSTGNALKSQVSIALAPWMIEGWHGLAHVLRGPSFKGVC